MEMYPELFQYCKTMSAIKLTLWKDLPRPEIYCDKLLKFVNDELSFMKNGDERLITKSMVNNYVKWGMIPKPVKKKYGQLQIASVLIITVLKQILPIVKIRDGIQLQIILHGTEKAYDAFCIALEESMQKVFLPILEERDHYVFAERKIDDDKLAISSITVALCNKLLTEKIIETKIKKYIKLEQGEGKPRE